MTVDELREACFALEFYQELLDEATDNAKKGNN